MYKSFTVKSKINGEYTVDFISELQLEEIIQFPDVIFVVDRVVAGLFSEQLSSVVSNSRILYVDCNEQNKTMDYAQEVIRQLLTLQVRKDTVLIAIGGGITQDIVAFISSILFRGIKWIFYPTTLLAQCDSCIGSKSSINFDQLKNLVGTFNPPNKIFIFPGFLKTLSKSEIQSGIGEMLHYFLKEGIEIANEIKEQYEDLLVNPDQLAYFISNSLRIKKEVIEIDEFDNSIRHVFNYGHTFGHAIEAVTNYAIPHGQAVSIGMDIANYLSMQKGLLAESDFNLMHSILEKNFPEFQLTSSNIELYLTALSKDKKNKGAKLGAILSKGPGKVEKVFIDMDEAFKAQLLNYSSVYGR